ncbi:MAG: DUF6273 domain-containing protein [Robinsoniella sp.]|nr:DUF6273 domain-containing protein [Robinsoniella sp.]
MNEYRKRKGGRMLSMLLALTVLLSGNGITMFTEAVSGNGMSMEVEAEAGLNGDAAYPDSSDVLQDEVDIPEEEVSASVSGNGERENPANPVHSSCNSGNLDTTTWSYVYFGNYPQSEVTDSATIAAIDDAIAAAGTTADAGMDVEVNGTKYRRISENDTNYSGYFDDVENNGYRYFKWEPIKWKVLQNDGSTLFVIADKAIDCKDYNDEMVSATWETSTIREWLNGSFYHAAFSSSEQGAIVEQTVVNEDNPEFGTEGGNDTNDKVCLLSRREITNEAYGFCSDDGIFSMSRRVKTSDYANARGVERDRSSAYEDNCWWWLRSPGAMSGLAAPVSPEGAVEWAGFLYVDDYGVCPALHINLSSGIWSMVNDGASSEVGNDGEYAPANPVHSCFAYKEDSTDFSYVYFGRYPQSEVTDSATIAAIDETIATAGTTADAGMDVEVNGTKYRRISKNDTNNSEYFDDVENNGYRYFKWEPIKWKVLQNDGSTLFVAADAIDCKAYNDEDVSTTWETSTIRDWLNDSFYGTAFSSSEQNAIIIQDVVNEDNPDWSTEGGNNTSDKIYLLSIGEVADETYGFCSDYDNESMSRRVKVSDYANARGTYSGIEDGIEIDGWWWLRSPGGNSSSAAVVGKYRSVFLYGGYVLGRNVSVCPALHINLSSDLWSVADDETSGEGGNGGGSGEGKILTGLQATKTKKEYVQGEQLDLDDLTVTAVYYGASREALLAGSYTTNAGSIPMNTPGKYALEISYTEKGITKKAAITITVKEKTGGSTQQPGSSTQQPGDNTQNQSVKVTKLTITAPSGKLAAGKKIKLAVKAEPENASDKTVTWKSSNTKYATVDKNGKVALKKAGAGKSVTITATANDGSGKKATVKLKIMKHAVKSIKLKAPKRTLKTGKSMTIKATVKTTGSNANKTLKWTSSNTKYATVKSGKVTAKKAGKGKTVTITAESTDGSGKKVKVKIKIQ